MATYFESMAKARATDWGPKVEPPNTSANTVLKIGELFVDLAGLIDVEAEITRNGKERERLVGAITGKEKKLANVSFVERAPADVVEGERRSLSELRDRLTATEATLAALEGQRPKGNK
jgi:valyl-tRNA synthetase